MKRALLLLAAITVLLSFAGCMAHNEGEAENDSIPTQTPQPSVETVPNSVDEQPAPEAEVIRLADINREKAENKVIFESTVLMQKISGEQPLVPESFVISGNNMIIDDHADRTISVYEDGSKIGNMPISEYNGVVDMGIREDSLYYLNKFGSLMCIDDNGERVAVSAEELVFDYDMPNQLIMYYDDIIIATDSLRKMTLTDSGVKWIDYGHHYDYSHSEKTFSAVDKATGAAFVIECEYEAAEIRELYRDDRYVYFFITEVDYQHPEGNQYYKYVFKFEHGGKLAATYVMEDAFVYVPNRQVAVYDDKVYQMLVTENSVQILELRELL